MPKLPSQFVLFHLLDYDPMSGLLLWRERPSSMFMNSAHSAEHQAAKWNSLHAGEPASSLGANGYFYTSLDGKNVLTHRVIWKLTYNTEPAEIDHINGCRTDNSLVNLRSVDRTANMRNMKRSKRNTSGTTGVSFRPDRGVWRAYIHVDGRIKTLGHFATAAEAAAARRAADENNGYHVNHGR